jgi:hypothetical protein
MDISGIFNPPAQQSVSDAIEHAADATGASFEYMLATARAESSMNPQAASTTSSARGLYQFIEQTWLATLKRSGPSLGYGTYADAIVQTAPGRYEVPDASMRRDIMALRDDPAANAAMAGALTRDNAAQLAARLGRKATDGELYIAHVLGSAGAIRLTTLTATSPGAAADVVFPAAAEANRSIFYDRQGHARSVAEVYGGLIGRYDGARSAGTPSVAGPAPFDLGRAVTAVFRAIVPAGTTDPAGVPAAPAPVAAIPAEAATPPAAQTAAGVEIIGAPLALVAAPTATVPVAAATANAPPDPPQPAAVAAPLFRGLFSDSGGPSRQFVPDLWKARPAPGSLAPASAAAPLAAGGLASDVNAGEPRDAAGLFRR